MSDKANTDDLKIIKGLKNELDSLRPLSEEDESRLWEKFRMEWNFHSNHIEGNTLTYGQTEQLLVSGELEGEHPQRDVDEMKAHDLAMKTVKQLAEEESERGLIEKDIRDWNLILLKEPFWKRVLTPEEEWVWKKITPGVYKEDSNRVKTPTGEIHEYPPPIDMEPLMEKLLGFYEENKDCQDLHPVDFAALLHHELLRIHPFDDGNGRTARLLMNYELMRWGYPPVVIRFKERERYYQALSSADQGSTEELLQLIRERSEWALGLSKKAAKGESITEEGDLEKELALLRHDLRGKDQQ